MAAAAAATSAPQGVAQPLLGVEWQCQLRLQHNAIKFLQQHLILLAVAAGAAKHQTTVHLRQQPGAQLRISLCTVDLDGIPDAKLALLLLLQLHRLYLATSYDVTSGRAAAELATTRPTGSAWQLPTVDTLGPKV